MQSEINSSKDNADRYKPVKLPQSYLRSFIREFKCTFSKQLQLNFQGPFKVLSSFGILSSFFTLPLQNKAFPHGPMSCIANSYFVEGIKVPHSLVSKGKGKNRQ